MTSLKNDFYLILIETRTHRKNELEMIRFLNLALFFSFFFLLNSEGNGVTV